MKLYRIVPRDSLWHALKTSPMNGWQAEFWHIHVRGLATRYMTGVTLLASERLTRIAFIRPNLG